MPFNRFDVSTKELIWDDPAAVLERLGVGLSGPVTVIDSDITTLTASADKVIQIGGPEPYLVDLELQSSHDADLVENVWFRQAGLFRRHRLAVLTIVVLLRREASSPSITGSFEIKLPDGWLVNRYNYRVARLWTEETEPFLTGGVNVVPLAPLTNLREETLPGVVQRMAARINAEPEARAAKLWTASYLLMGLRFSEDLVSKLLEGVHNMQESTTYQAILREGEAKGREEGREEGRIAGERLLLVRLGSKRFGKPDPVILARIEAIGDIERLEALGERIVDPEVSDWSGVFVGS